MAAILADDIFNCISWMRMIDFKIQMSLKYVPRGPIDHKPALVQVMAWRRTGDKPLPGLMMAQFIVRRAGLLWSWVVVICPIIKCLTVSEFSFILFDLCLFITIFNFILNYVPIITFWIFTYHKIWILLIIFCFIWNYWIIYFLTCFEVFWSVVS